MEVREKGGWNEIYVIGSERYEVRKGICGARSGVERDMQSEYTGGKRKWVRVWIETELTIIIRCRVLHFPKHPSTPSTSITSHINQ